MKPVTEIKTNRPFNYQLWFHFYSVELSLVGTPSAHRRVCGNSLPGSPNRSEPGSRERGYINTCQVGRRGSVRTTRSLLD